MKEESKRTITTFNLTYIFTNEDLDIISSFLVPSLLDLRNVIKYDIVHQPIKPKLFLNTIFMQFKNYMPFYAVLPHQLWRCLL